MNKLQGPSRAAKIAPETSARAFVEKATWSIVPVAFAIQSQNWIPYFKTQAVSKTAFLRFNKWETLLIDL